MTIDNVLEILEKHKLHIPSNVFYELKADIVNFEEPTTKNNLEVDCISREQALVAIRNLYPDMPRVDFNGSLRKWVDKYKPYIECDDAIKQLPSVTPIRPKGHWITRPHIYGVAFCSECGFELKINNTNYCPNCGADMRGNTKRKGKSINGNNESYNCENWIP